MLGQEAREGKMDRDKICDAFLEFAAALRPDILPQPGAGPVFVPQGDPGEVASIRLTAEKLADILVEQMLHTSASTQRTVADKQRDLANTSLSPGE